MRSTLVAPVLMPTATARCWVTTSEDGAGWLASFRDLVARGLTGARLVTADAHAGLVAAITATLPGAA